MGTVIRLNTGAIWRLSGLKDLNEYYEQYYTRIFNISPGGKEYLESIKELLDANKESNFTIKELATFQQIDLPGVVDYMDGRNFTFKKQLLSEVRGEPCTDEAARSAYSIVSAASAWTDYFRVTWNQIVRGKFAEETNLLGTIGEIGMAFVGFDFVQDFRDFTYGAIFWDEGDLQDKVETVINGAASLLPIVGVLAKGDELLALIKHGDNVMELRNIEKLTEIKGLDSVRYIDEFGLMPGTAGDMLIDIDGSTYRMILETSSEYDFYRNCYNNPIAEGFADCSEAVGYLKTTAPGTLEEIAEEAAQQTGKSADEVEEFVEEALEDARKKVDAEGGLDSNLLKELANSGVKYNPEDIVAITKTANGKLVWLENGTDTAGLNHIIAEHASDFLNKGIDQDQIPDYIMNALAKGKIVGYQGNGTGRPIYEFTYNGEIHKVAITVGNNGFVVGANPK